MWRVPLTPTLPAKSAALSGENSCISEPQLIEREAGFWLARINWRRLVDFCDRTSHEEALANELGEAQVQHSQGIQTPREAQEQIGDHRGDDLQADSIVVVADELAKVEMLLDPAEQQFDLPAALVKSRDLDCCTFEIIVGNSDQSAFVTPDFDSSKL